MLGWEYAPIKSGGLGVACRGITEGLNGEDVDVTFVMPAAFHGGGAEMDLERVKVVSRKLKHVKIFSPSHSLNNPYNREEILQSMPEVNFEKGKKSLYGADFFQEIEKFTAEAIALGKVHDHDVIHAHDWMTFEAAAQVKANSGKPFVAHVHATEIDRTGGQPHDYIFEKEKRGLEQADHIIVVSFYTKKILEQFYGIPGDKISVVHNAAKVEVEDYDGKNLQMAKNPLAIKDKVVLFLGRVTLQKGPEYFVEMAKKVLEKRNGVKFIIAGTGDMMPKIVHLIAESGLSDKILLTGYLTGEPLNRALYHADLYVMPSVSEPFGISALEAVEFGTPVLISKTSGAREVIHNSLRAEFWDIEKMANQAIAILDYPVLGKTLVEESQKETKFLTWKQQAKKIREVYQSLILQHA